MNEQPVRILYLIDTLVSARAGTEGQLAKLISGLPRDRFQPYLACFLWTPWMESNSLGVPRFCIGSNRLRSPRFASHLYRFASYLRREKIDIIQCHFPTSIAAGVLAARLAGVRHILSCRRDMGYWYSSPYRILLRFCNRFVERVVTNSVAVSRCVEKAEGVHPSKIRVVYNGIRIPERIPDEQDRRRIAAQMGAAPEDIVVGMVANMNRRVKRVDVFLRAAARVLQEIPRVRFVVIGSGDLMVELRDLSRHLGIDQSAIFMGSQEDPMQFVQGFDIGVSSSDSEGFSNAVLEYMACGIPVVATNSGGSVEVIRHGGNGVLVEPGDPTSLARGILDLLSDKQKRVTLGMQARADAAEYSVERMIDNYTELYANLLND